MKVGDKTLSQVFGKIMLKMANLPMPGSWRWRLVKMAGVKFLPPPANKKRFSFIGENVVFDSLLPQKIVIGNNVIITYGCLILTHHWNADNHTFSYGETRICDDVYIGAYSIITRPVTIGEGAVVGAGSVVTKDIPPYQLWAGSPARYIKDLPRLNKI